jgi:exodeoxyribonuclease VII small subunit
MAQKKIDYKELNSDLEDILLALQQPDLDVDEAMAKYERGLALVTLLEDHLENAENTVSKLKAQLDVS